MPMIVCLDVMMALRKREAKDLAVEIGITKANLSLLRTGKVKGVRCETLAVLCEALSCLIGADGLTESMRKRPR
ncbi:helix-turn-helix domain-containing protein [Deinococcus marmoris]|nr:helix-turn-helix domain-containing protein [Deinococcus marmoris]